MENYKEAKLDYINNLYPKLNSYLYEYTSDDVMSAIITDVSKFFDRNNLDIEVKITFTGQAIMILGKTERDKKIWNEITDTNNKS